MRSNLKDGVSVDVNFTHDPYKFDSEDNVRIDELDNFPRLVAARLATNFTIRSKSEPTEIEKEKEFSEDTKKFLNDLSGNNWNSRILQIPSKIFGLIQIHLSPLRKTGN